MRTEWQVPLLLIFLKSLGFEDVLSGYLPEGSS